MPDPKSLLGFLTMDMTQEQQKGAWRLAWRVVLAVAMVGGYGFFSWAGFSGFAYADDVRELGAEVTSIKLELIEQQIWDTRARQCEAVNSEQQASARVYGERLSQLLSKYQALTARSFQLLSCKEQ